MTKTEEAAVLAMLNYADLHPEAVRLVNPERHWTHVYAGNVQYQITMPEGHVWEVEVFNDCDCWDYLDAVTAPDGAMWDYPCSEKARPMTQRVADWEPEHMHWYADEPHKAELWKEGPRGGSLMDGFSALLSAGVHGAALSALTEGLVRKRVESDRAYDAAVRAGRKPV